MAVSQQQENQGRAHDFGVFGMRSYDEGAYSFRGSLGFGIGTKDKRFLALASAPNKQ